MRKIVILSFLGLLYAFQSYSQITCVLSGKVIDRPYSTTLLLFPVHTDDRIQKPIEIPIQNGKFLYELEVPEVGIYTLCFLDEYVKGSMRIFNFVAENDTVRFELYPSRNQIPRIVGGASQKRYQFLMSGSEIGKVLDSLETRMMELDYTKEAYTNEGFKVFTLLKDAFERKDRVAFDSLNTKFKEMEKYSALYLKLQQQIKDISESKREWLLDQIESNCDPIGLAIIHDLFWTSVAGGNATINMNRLQHIYKTQYKKLYPTSDLCRQIEVLLVGAELKQGGPFVDFTAPDLTGSLHRLSDEIRGKVTVLDLWASWCGPCMQISQALIPIYEKYKDKGFTIVGVARESKDTRAMKKAIERLKLPWLNLVDLDDNLSIWRKYGVGNGGGKVFLIDAQGKVQLLHPTPEEIENELQKLFGQ